MVFNTASVGAAVTPTVVETLFSHYLNRKPLRRKPTAHVSYDVGLRLVRQFLTYASHHTVEDMQAFTSQWVPHPRWVRIEDVAIPQTVIDAAADHLCAELGPAGLDAVGGQNWWRWRRDGSTLKADWIEMRKDYNERQKSGEECRRCMLYVHGGAYYFGSVDEHRYQMQRHARKLKARVFAPRYRLSPQFPFPCGLLDCLAAYLHLLTIQKPETIVLAGDSAGGGMILSLLVLLRDQGLPLPAGAILLSPWVDLTHSFPSVAADSPFDYVPSHGFLHRPSRDWPPPTAEDYAKLEETKFKSAKNEKLSERDRQVQAALQARKERSQQLAKQQLDGVADETGPTDVNTFVATIGGKKVVVKEQIQMYAHNTLISHPLVSPVLQPTLGGLPPLLFLVGGGEMLRDEQIYTAHKAADPERYPAPPNPFHTAEAIDRKYPPTHVQLQVWEDLCHVAPTLSFTRPAKYMYRSVAQFGAWVLARAQDTEIDILDDDAVSIISSRSATSESLAKPPNKDERLDRKDADTSKSSRGRNALRHTDTSNSVIGKAGDALPPFKDHMIRQRVTRHGDIMELEPASELPACNMTTADIGVVKAGPVQKWLAAKHIWNENYQRHARQISKLRQQEMENGGYEQFFGPDGTPELPPPSALAGRRIKGVKNREPAKKKSRGLAIWSGVASKHDEDAIEREQEMEDAPEQPAPQVAVIGPEPSNDLALPISPRSPSRSHSRMKAVGDTGQTGADKWAASAAGVTGLTVLGSVELADTSTPVMENTLQPVKTSASAAARPMLGDAGQAAFMPFKLNLSERDDVSTMTLNNQSGVVTPIDEHPSSGADAPATSIAAETSAAEPNAAKEVERPQPERFVTASDVHEVQNQS